MAKRKTISKKVRFEVFKRDSFTCQYCGKCAPEVTLHVDHIEPVSKGGDNSLINLITACAECNLGKSDRKLSDQTMLAKQQEQLAALNERREQLEMMVQWRKALLDMGDQELDLLVLEVESLLGGMAISQSGIGELRKLLRKHGYQEAIKTATTCIERYVEWKANGLPEHASIIRAFRSFERVASYSKLPPEVQAAHYTRGILRNRFPDDVYPGSDEWVESLDLMLDGMTEGAFTARDLKESAKSAESYAGWYSENRAAFDHHLEEVTVAAYEAAHP